MRRTEVLRGNCTAFLLIDISVRLDIGSALLDQMLNIAKNRLMQENAYANINEAPEDYIASRKLDLLDAFGKATATAAILTATWMF